MKHAYIPDVHGKERRKRAPGKEGKLGVEGMPPAVLLQALERAGATFEDGEALPEKGTRITKADLMELGLAGPGSVERRSVLQRQLDLPERLTANGLLEALISSTAGRNFSGGWRRWERSASEGAGGENCPPVPVGGGAQESFFKKGVDRGDKTW